MAKIQINKATTDRSGGSVPANALIGANTYFIFNTLDIIWETESYRSQVDLDNGKTPVMLNEVPLRLKKTMTQAEYDSLAGANALGIVMGWLKDELIETGNFVDSDLTIIP